MIPTSSGAAWLDNEHLIFEILRKGETLILNIFTGEIRRSSINLPDEIASANEDSPSRFVTFSPNRSYYFFSTSDKGYEAWRGTFKLVDADTGEILGEFLGSYPRWNSVSTKIYYSDEAGNIYLINLGGASGPTKLSVPEVETTFLTESPDGRYLIVSGFLKPRTVMPSSVILFGNLNTGEIVDICIYGALQADESSSEPQAGAWSGNGKIFAFMMNTAYGHRLFLMDAENFTLSDLLLHSDVYLEWPIIVGWASLEE
jgi:hypothetical protein